MRRLLVAVAAVAMGIAGAGFPAYAGGVFSNKSFKGNYALSLTGSDLSQSSICTAPPCPVALTGQLSTNGKGAITGGSLNLNDNGILCSGSFSNGSYSIQNDGTGSVLALVGNASGCNNNLAFPMTAFSLTVTLYNGGKQATIATGTTSPAGLVMSGSAASQNRIP
jgi:hypothetical protein